jgi:N-acetylglucosaminyl-diphospho-decaprenol L-rhamnosyltransferase
VIDVVVVTERWGELAQRCVERLTDPSIATVRVVVNGSQAVENPPAGVDVVSLSEPTSLAAAYNGGAARGSSEYILFLNDDVFARSGAVAATAAALESDRGAVAAVGRLVDAETGRTQLEYQPQAFPGVLTFVAAFTGLAQLWPRNPWTGRRPVLEEWRPSRIDRPAGACMLVRRSVFEDVGRWDEGFTLWFEDVDFARRLRKLGSILYVPTAVFEHVGGASTQRLGSAEVVEHTYLGALRYASKHFGPGRRVALAALYGAVGIARGATTHDPGMRAAYRSVRRGARELVRGASSR